MRTLPRLAVFALFLLVASVLGAYPVRSQSAPNGGQHPNHAIAFSLAAVESATTPQSAKARLVSGGVLNTVVTATGVTPAAARAGAVPAGPPPLAVQPRSEGCRTVYTGGGAPSNVRVNQDCTLRRQAEEFVAINPTDPADLIVGYNNSRIGFNHMALSYSLDRGRTWGDVLPPFFQFVAKDGHTFDAASDPAVAFDSRGNAYFAGVLFDLASPATAVLVTKSSATFKGSTFHSPSPAPNPATQVFRAEPSGVVANDADPAIANDKEFIAADQSPTSPKRDTVYVTWTRFRANCGPLGSGYCESPIYFSQSTDGGATWSPGIAISGANPAVCVGGNGFDPALDASRCNFDQGSYPVVGSDSAVYVAFNNGNTPTIVAQQLLVRCPATADCSKAASWEGPFKVGDDVDTQPFDSPSCPQAPGRQCLPPNSFRIDDFPALAIDRSSNALYVVWADFRNGGPCATGPSGLPAEPCASHDNDVVVARSTDRGSTWGPTTRVGSDDSKAAQLFPAVAVTATGSVIVSYYDRRYGCETFGCLDYTASLTTGGSDWRDRRVTTSSMPAPEANPVEAGFLGDYTSAAADGQGMVVVWADTRGLYGQNEQDVYLAQLATAGGGLPMPGSPNTGVSTETPGP